MMRALWTSSGDFQKRFPCCRRRRGGPHLASAVVLGDDVLTGQILRCISIGSLQMLSMTNRLWLDWAFRLASNVDVDMASWPFAVTEWHKYKRRPRLCLSPSLVSDFNTMRLDKQDWKNPELKDSMVTDSDLEVALRRFGTTQLARLVASSSSLRSSSICWALKSFSKLQELCLSSCGSGKLGAEVQTSLDLCTSLRLLHLDRVQLRPPPAEGLSELIVGRRVMQDLWALGHFQQLRVLNLSSDAFMNTALGLSHPGSQFQFQNDKVYCWLLETFKQCDRLQEIQIYAVTEVTNEMLAVLMEHVSDLRKFAGCHTKNVHTFGSIDFPFKGGARSLDAGSLSAEATDAFRAHFPAASIFVDDVLADTSRDWPGT